MTHLKSDHHHSQIPSTQPTDLSQPVFPLSDLDLKSWTDRARLGGLATGFASCDHIAQNPHELMFMRGEQITLLQPWSNPQTNQVSDSSSKLFLAFCEGVVGIVSIENVKLESSTKPLNPPSTLKSNLNLAILDHSASQATKLDSHSKSSSVTLARSVTLELCSSPPRLTSVQKGAHPSDTAASHHGSVKTELNCINLASPPSCKELSIDVRSGTPEPRAPFHLPLATSTSHPSNRSQPITPVSASSSPSGHGYLPLPNPVECGPKLTAHARPALKSAEGYEIHRQALFINIPDPSFDTTFLKQHSSGTCPGAQSAVDSNLSSSGLRPRNSDSHCTSERHLSASSSSTNVSSAPSTSQPHLPLSSSNEPTSPPATIHQRPNRVSSRANTVGTTPRPNMKDLLDFSAAIKAFGPEEVSRLPKSAEPRSRPKRLPRQGSLSSLSTSHPTPDAATLKRGLPSFPSRIEPFLTKRAPSKPPVAKRMISAPKLTLHTNAMIEQSTGITATPHSTYLATKGGDKAMTEELSLLAISTATAPSEYGLIALPPPPEPVVQPALSRPVSSSSLSSLFHRRRSSPHLSESAPRFSLIKDVLNSPSEIIADSKIMATVVTARHRSGSRKRSSRPSTLYDANGTIIPTSRETHVLRPDDHPPQTITIKGGPEFELVTPHVPRHPPSPSETDQMESLQPVHQPSPGASSASLPTAPLPHSEGDGLSEEDEQEPREESKDGSNQSVVDPYEVPRPMRSSSNGGPIEENVRELMSQEYQGFKANVTPFEVEEPEDIGWESYRIKEQKWINLLSTVPDWQANSNKKVKKLMRLGVPKSLRGRVWSYILNVNEFKSPGLWQQLLNRGKLNKVYDEIETDLGRCLPNHPHFCDPSTKTTAIADLRSLLRAFAHYSAQLPPEERIVYSSDIGTVAGFLLVHSPVEEAFWNLVGIVRRLLPGYWSEINCLHGFRKAAAVFDGLLRECDSGVARHLAAHKLDATSYLPTHFLQLFIKTLPWLCLEQVMDLFISEGEEILHRIGLAIFELARYRILACRSPSALTEFISHPPAEILSATVLLPVALRLKIKQAQVDKLGQRWDKLSKNGQLN